jgi:hypothetical protein
MDRMLSPSAPAGPPPGEPTWDERSLRAPLSAGEVRRKSDPGVIALAVDDGGAERVSPACRSFDAHRLARALDRVTVESDW